MREGVAEWAGRDVISVLATLDANDPGILDETARLTYCPRCWDDDVVSGRAATNSLRLNSMRTPPEPRANTLQ